MKPRTCAPLLYGDMAGEDIIMCAQMYIAHENFKMITFYERNSSLLAGSVCGTPEAEESSYSLDIIRRSRENLYTAILLTIKSYYPLTKLLTEEEEEEEGKQIKSIAQLSD